MRPEVRLENQLIAKRQELENYRAGCNDAADRVVIELDDDTAIGRPNLGALDAYTLAHCYAFHSFTVEAAKRIDLGEGVFGNAFVYTSPRADWRAVSWQWPVRRGVKVEHERLVLIAASDARPAGRGTPSSGGEFSRVLALLDWRSSGHDANLRLTRALQRVAAGIVRKRIEAAT